MGEKRDSFYRFPSHQILTLLPKLKCFPLLNQRKASMTVVLMSSVFSASARDKDNFSILISVVGGHLPLTQTLLHFFYDTCCQVVDGL